MRPQLVKPNPDNEEMEYLRASILSLIVRKAYSDSSCKPIHEDCKFANDLRDLQ